MRQVNFIPQLEKVNLFRWEESIIFSIEFKVTLNGKGEVVVNITLEGTQIVLENANPQYK
jgi:hypothetical protein